MNIGYGYAVKTSDGVVGTSGTPKQIAGVLIIDDGNASTVKFYDGTGTSGTLVFQVTTTAGVPTNLWFTGGLNFHSGCYVDVDAHTTQAVVGYREIK